ncbi:hypothetical protein RBSH_05870 [Rhodopirellula baltica SH28]|uniref:Uncharacterized protein n=1 Tax=Rhodopirellula baltica SH28 TaxID=993517 RepID=K5D8N6_RHOBT|nr:hypothetical protein RBSH_05870 [Rhodopirellula baltica SH28]
MSGLVSNRGVYPHCISLTTPARTARNRTKWEIPPMRLASDQWRELASFNLNTIDA